MTDYISREDALNFEMEIEADPEEIQAISKGMALYAEYIKSIPAAEVTEPKQGHWIVKTVIPKSQFQERYRETTCSECKNHVAWPTKFCSQCGAKMRGDSDV